MVVLIQFKKEAGLSSRNITIDTESQELVDRLDECKDYNAVMNALAAFKGQYKEVRSEGYDVIIDISTYMKKANAKMLKAFGSKPRAS